MINFAIINLAPGDPTSQMNVNASGDAVQSEGMLNTNPYHLFRKEYGLNLPLFFNLWPWLSLSQAEKALTHIAEGYENQMLASKHHQLKQSWIDKVAFVPKLWCEAIEKNPSLKVKQEGLSILAQALIKQGHRSAFLTPKQKSENQKTHLHNVFFESFKSLSCNQVDFETQYASFKAYATKHGFLSSSFHQTKWKILFSETRFYRYLSKVLRCDFGTLRNDANKTVVSQVIQRIKYSITLCLIPLLLSFFLCQFFGMIMALKNASWIDHSLNFVFLILYAVPIFVVVPFLIEHSLGKTFWFSKTPIPLSGFHSPNEAYDSLMSYQRLKDILLHLMLPLIAAMYSHLAVQSRLCKAAFLNALSQPYILAAKAKGLKKSQILLDYVVRNGAITLVTCLTTSIGVLLSGTLVIETLFGIDGFGQFFYQGILNRDYNVVLFSTLVGSLLSIIGYLLGDFAYVCLDPRVRLQ